MINTGKAVFLIIFLVLFWGCIGIKQPDRKIAYYTLEYAHPVFEVKKPLSSVIRIDRFTAAPFCNSNKIIYRERSFKRNEYHYHKWRTNPGDLVTYFLLRDIGESSLFKAALSFDSRPPSSHLLEGMVDEFYEEDHKDFREAVLSISVTLMAENEQDSSKSVLLQKRYSARETCRQKNPIALAEAMSKAMARISEMIITDVYSTLEETM